MKTQTVLQKAKRLARKRGLTYEQVGVKMGWPKKSARQSAWQFLNSTNPSLAMLLRFCKATEIDVKDLFEGKELP